ncbi:hypothetical protein ACIQCQ_36900 [Streptomyces sp. NPDC088394]|uniref:hypothetical protein n=1 Tax=Streptomyces sp. NPDC088394 TaxID=3365860 RepID=UPI003807434B
MTYKQGGATAKEAADHCGLTVQATRRIAKELAENKRPDVFVRYCVGSIRALSHSRSGESSASYKIRRLRASSGSSDAGRPKRAVQVFHLGQRS